MNTSKNHFLFKTICFVLIGAFVTLDIAWAHPAEVATLATRTPFQAPLNINDPAELPSFVTESSFIYSILDLGNFFFGEKKPVTQVDAVKSQELGALANGFGLEDLKFFEDRTEAVAKGLLDNVLYIPYKVDNKTYLVQVALKDNPQARSLVGYGLLIDEKYIVVVAPDDYEGDAKARPEAVQTAPATQPMLRVSEPIVAVEVRKKNPTGDIFTRQVTVRRILSLLAMFVAIPFIAFPEEPGKLVLSALAGHPVYAGACIVVLVLMGALALIAYKISSNPFNTIGSFSLEAVTVAVALNGPLALAFIFLLGPFIGSVFWEIAIGAMVWALSLVYIFIVDAPKYNTIDHNARPTTLATNAYFLFRHTVTRILQSVGASRVYDVREETYDALRNLIDRTIQERKAESHVPENPELEIGERYEVAISCIPKYCADFYQAVKTVRSSARESMLGGAVSVYENVDKIKDEIRKVSAKYHFGPKGISLIKDIFNVPDQPRRSAGVGGTHSKSFIVFFLGAMMATMDLFADWLASQIGLSYFDLFIINLCCVIVVGMVAVPLANHFLHADKVRMVHVVAEVHIWKSGRSLHSDHGMMRIADGWFVAGSDAEKSFRRAYTQPLQKGRMRREGARAFDEVQVKGLVRKVNVRWVRDDLRQFAAELIQKKTGVDPYKSPYVDEMLDTAVELLRVYGDFVATSQETPMMTGAEDDQSLPSIMVTITGPTYAKRALDAKSPQSMKWFDGSEIALAPSCLMLKPIERAGSVVNAARVGDQVGVKVIAHIDVIDSNNGQGTHIVQPGANDTMREITTDFLGKIGERAIKDVHIMVMEKKLDAGFVMRFIENGADIISLHWEGFTDKDKLLRLLRFIRAHGVKAGLALNPDVALSDAAAFITEHSQDIDMVLQMSVQPGKGGQKFDATGSARQNIRLLRERYRYKGRIEIDGGINVETIQDAARAGASIFVAGAAFFNKDDLGDEAMRRSCLTLSASATEALTQTVNDDAPAKNDAEAIDMPRSVTYASNRMKAEVHKLFAAVMNTVNNRRADIVERANAFQASGSKPIDRRALTVVVKERIRNVIRAIKDAGGAATSTETNASIVRLEKDFYSLDADSLVSSFLILARRAERDNNGSLVVALETDWIPGMNDKNSSVYKPTNQLTTKIEQVVAKLRHMGQTNVSVIHASSAELAEKAKQENERLNGNNLRHMVFMASSRTVTNEDFQAIRATPGANRPFLGIIDPKGFDEDLHNIKDPGTYTLDYDLLAYVTFLMEVAVGKKLPKDFSSMVVLSYNEELREVTVEAHAEMVRINDMPEIHEARETALASA